MLLVAGIASVPAGVSSSAPADASDRTGKVIPSVTTVAERPWNVPVGHDAGWMCAFLTENTPRALGEFQTAVGRPLDCVATYLDRYTWGDLTGLSPLSAPSDPLVSWVAEQPAARRLALSVPMVPLSETTAGGVDWRVRGAAGEFDPYWRAFAERAVSVGLGRSIVRLGWESNGAWFPENFIGTSDAQVGAWRAYFRRIVDVVRSVPGGQFLIDFNVNVGGSGTGRGDGRTRPLTDWYPGRDYVDAIGVDVYDRWIPGFNRSRPPSGPTSAEVSTWYEQRWRSLFEMQNSLRDCLKLARHDGLPLSVGEWAMSGGEGGSAGAGDNAWFVHQMGAVVAQNPTLYTAYANYRAGGIGMTLVQAPQGLSEFRRSISGADR